jgi:phosphatidylserine decarboxylase
MVITGIYYALGLSVGGLVVAYLASPIFGIPFFLLAVFCLNFFRDPDRVVPQGAHAVSPADGKVLAVRPEGDSLTRITIFLNVFDVHVNRTPIAGKITRIDYKPGDFLVASREEASLANEQNVVTVEGSDGVKVIFKQIAGLVARRIVFNKKVGDVVAMGDRIGLMKFGSRMDVHFGPEWEIAVREGQKVQAATTILARRKAV